MEYLINCNLVLNIEMVDQFIGGNQSLDVFVTLTDKSKFRISFSGAWDFRYSIENACIDRFAKFIRKTKTDSSILMVENSEYIRYFEQQVSGTRLVKLLKEYIVFDQIDTVLSILSEQEPVLTSI